MSTVESMKCCTVIAILLSMAALFVIVRYMTAPDMTSYKKFSTAHEDQILHRGHDARSPHIDDDIMLHRDHPERIPYKDMYHDIPRCIVRKSTAACTFPFLAEYTQQCGEFPRLTYWKGVSRENPDKTTLRSSVCSLPPIGSANKRLIDYVKQRNITSIAVFGDSNGRKTNEEIVRRLQSGFACKMVKTEPAGFKIHMDYYTAFSGTNFTVDVRRTCTSCTSHLYSCSDISGRKLSVEYISMTMSFRQTIDVHQHPVCKSDRSHPLCFNMSQPEYVFKHYLNRPGHTYPQLILYVGSLAHNNNAPLGETYDGLLHLQGLLRAHVPATTHVICYSYSMFDERKATDDYWGSAVDDPGYNINEKLRAQNHFLAKMLANHKKAGYRPLLYPFLDLYHMKWQLRGAWATDKVHSIRAWYENVVGYTATLLHSLPAKP